MSLYEIRGPARTMKNIHNHYSFSTKLYNWRSALGQVAFSWHPPNPDLSFGLPFPLLQSPMAASFTPLQPTLVIVHGDLRLVCSCSAMETHILKLPTIVLTLLPEVVWNSVLSVATEDRLFVHATCFSGPVLWACTTYHFAAEPLLLLDVST